MPLLKNIPKPLLPSNKPSTETGITISFKNLNRDKSTLLLLLDSTMDMPKMDIFHPRISELLKLLLFTITISVKNTKSTKMTLRLKSPVSCMEDIKEIIMEEETLGSSVLEL